MNIAREPGAVLRALMEGICDRRWDELDALYADDAVVEHPFALPVPTRLVGRAAIRTHFANFSSAPFRMLLDDFVVHRTDDAEAVVAEWAYIGFVTTTALPFRVRNVQVSRVRNGLIVDSRDYHNHALMAALSGRPIQLHGPTPTST